MKKIDVHFSSVDIVVHQDALMDIVDKINKFTEEVLNNTKNLLVMQEQPDFADSPRDSPEPRKLSRKSSVRLPAKARWRAAGNAVKLSNKVMRMRSEDSPVNLKVIAKLQSVNFYLMTSKINLAQMRVQDLRSTYVDKRDLKEITAKLVDFEILDTSKNHTLYR